MIRKCLMLIICLVVVATTGCKDEEEITTSIVGKWKGSSASFKINPNGIIPPFTLNEEDFPVQLTFENEGKLILTDNKGVSKNGTYNLNGNKLTINVDYTIELMELSGVYDVKVLTPADLSVEISKEGSYTLPDTQQQIDGTVTATLDFTKSSN